MKITINGVNVATAVVWSQPVLISHRQGERSSASFTMKPGHTCAPLDDVVIYEVDDTTIKFQGKVFPGPAARTVEDGGDAQYWTDVACVDAMALLDWTVWTKTYAAPVTLSAMLADLQTDVLAALGIAIDAAQDTGDTLDPFTLDAVQVSQFLRNVCGFCNPKRVLRINPLANALRVLVPGVDTAPFSISDANPNCLDLQWRYTDFTPANTVVARCGQAGEWELRQTFIGDGSTTAWDVDTAIARLPFMPLGTSDPRTMVTVNGVDINPPETGGAFEIEYNTPTSTDRLKVGTYGTPALGDVIVFRFAVQGPFTVRRTTGATPPLVQPLTLADQYADIEPYIKTVASALAALSGAPREVTIYQAGDVGTFGASLLTGQKILATLTSRGLSAATLTITQIDWTLRECETTSERYLPSTPSLTWVSTIKAVESTVPPGSMYDQIRAMLGGSGGSGFQSVSGGSSSSTTPGVTLSALHLGGGSDPDDDVMVATWAPPGALASPDVLIGPYPDDPLSPDAVRVPNAVVFKRDNVNGAPFPILEVLPFSFEIEADHDGYVKIGIVDLDSDYGHPIYVFSYTVHLTGGSPVTATMPRGGTWLPYPDNYPLQDDHRYVLMFEGARIGSPVGIDGATIRVLSAYTLIRLGATSVQNAPEPEPTLPAGSLLLPELRETSPNSMVAIDWAGTQLMPPPTIAFTAYYIGAIRGLDVGGYMIQHSTGFPNYVMKFLDVNLAVVGTYSGLTASSPRIGLSSNFVDAFYALDRTTMILRKFGPTGSVLQSWTLSATGLSSPGSTEIALAVSPDGTTAYYSENGFQKIKKADLTGGSTPADATFADESASDAGSGGLGVGADALVILRDGKVLAYWRGYEPAGVYTNEKNIIRIYNPDGTTYATYTVGFNSAYYGGGYYVVGIAANGVDSSSFLAVEADDDNNQGRVREYRVSDGAVLNTRLLADGALDPSDFLNGTGVLQMPVGATPVAATW